MIPDKYYRSIIGTPRVPFARAARVAVAALAAWFACAPFITDQAPVFAPIAAVMVVQPSVAATFSLCGVPLGRAGDLGGAV
jgi:hypothetical protein